MVFSAQLSETTNWVCAGISIVILIARAVIVRGTTHVNRIDQWLCITSVLVIAARLPMVYYLLSYSNIKTQIKQQGSASDSALQTLKEAVVLTLLARVLVTTYYWLQIALLLRFYSRLLGHVKWIHNAITSCWIAVFVTYVACILTIFLECRPISVYWTIPLDADKCTRAYIQVFTQGILNILLDICLLIIAFPMLVWNRFAIAQMVRIVVLVTLGTFCIIVTAVKLVYVVGDNSSQPTRTFWAAVQVLVSTFVANGPTIYGCLRLKIARAKEDKTETALTRARTRSDCMSGSTMGGDITKRNSLVPYGSPSTAMGDESKPRATHVEG